MDKIKMAGINPSSDLWIRRRIETLWKLSQSKDDFVENVKEVDLLYLRELLQGVALEYGIELYHTVVTKNKEK